MNSSTSNSSLIGDYKRLPRNEHIGHAVMAFAGLCILLGWLSFSPAFVPTCRTMAVRSLSPATEMIITGTSRVERGVDPRLFDKNMANLSSGGLSYLTMKPMIIRAIERAPNVKLVIIEFDIFLLKGKGLIQDRLIELGLPMSEWPESMEDRLWFILQHGGPLAAMPRIDVEYMAQSIQANERPPPESNGYNPYTFLRDLTSEDSDGLYGASKYIAMHRKELVGSLDDANIRALLDLLRWLDARDVRWALVTLPHLPGWISGRPDEWEASVDQALRTLGVEYPGEKLTFWDASASLGLGRPHFHDGLHLNRRGVELFNRELDVRIAGWLRN